MTPRTGRPKKGATKRDKQLTVMLSEGEIGMLNECAERKGETRTDIIVEGIRKVKHELDNKKE